MLYRIARPIGYHTGDCFSDPSSEVVMGICHLLPKWPLAESARRRHGGEPNAGNSLSLQGAKNGFATPAASVT
jgi:hypothetical protein